MSTAISGSATIRLVNYDIKENSTARYLLGLIPLIGIIANQINEHSLNEQISRCKDSSLLIGLIEVKNNYKRFTISRLAYDSLLIAVLLSKRSTLARTLGNTLCGLGLYSCVWIAYNIYCNKKAVEMLELEGYQPDLEIS